MDLKAWATLHRLCRKDFVDDSSVSRYCLRIRARRLRELGIGGSLGIRNRGLALKAVALEEDFAETATLGLSSAGRRLLGLSGRSGCEPSAWSSPYHYLCLLGGIAG